MPMPTISMFYGIIIAMYYNDHMPPHFHAEYQNYKALFSIEGELLNGDLPANKKAMVQVWAEIHREELLANWKLAKSKEELYRIEPLR
jgi:hypothetical protein